MKILVADTVYPDFLKTAPVGSGSYAKELESFLSKQFGTFYAYSRNLRALGHDCIDVIANHSHLQVMWARQYWEKCQADLLLTGNSYMTSGEILIAQIEHYQPDVVFLQDLSLVDVIRNHKGDYLVAAQCSCAMKDEQAAFCDVIFTSFPHYVPRIEALGVKAVYLPLAFEPSVLPHKKLDATTHESIKPEFIDGGIEEVERDIDISFVGGVGRDLHWRQGTDVLEAVAAAFPDRFQWWGYGLDRLAADSPLRRCYKGEAWGRKMYDIYRRSKIVINRHGEVAEGFANNMRMYEATGCGAFLLTDNRTDHFTEGFDFLRYSTPHEAVVLINYLLDEWNTVSAEGFRRPQDCAASGQRRTLRDHTYAQRMKIISRVVQEMLCPA